jgi:CheY-like chemotaxis protein
MSASKEKPTILAVDDTPENLDVVKGILADEYIVKAATSGAMALKIVEKQPPDLVLLDIMMPEMDGYEVCRRLKDDDVTRGIPVIFLTAMEQTTDEAKGFDLGAADYITKPVNPPILQARVRTHLALKQSMDELQAAYAIIKKHSERMEQELSVGHDIQMSMLPITFPEKPEFALHACLQPAREVGGDFYDFFFVDDDKICLVVGDVSGKGVPAALFMQTTRRRCSLRFSWRSSTREPVNFAIPMPVTTRHTCSAAIRRSASTSAMARSSVPLRASRSGRVRARCKRTTLCWFSPMA